VSFRQPVLNRGGNRRNPGDPPASGASADAAAGFAANARIISASSEIAASSALGTIGWATHRGAAAAWRAASSASNCPATARVPGDGTVEKSAYPVAGVSKRKASTSSASLGAASTASRGTMACGACCAVLAESDSSRRDSKCFPTPASPVGRSRESRPEQWGPAALRCFFLVRGTRGRACGYSEGRLIVPIDGRRLLHKQRSIRLDYERGFGLRGLHCWRVNYSGGSGVSSTHSTGISNSLLPWTPRRQPPGLQPLSQRAQWRLAESQLLWFVPRFVPQGNIHFNIRSRILYRRISPLSFEASALIASISSGVMSRGTSGARPGSCPEGDAFPVAWATRSCPPYLLSSENPGSSLLPRFPLRIRLRFFFLFLRRKKTAGSSIRYRRRCYSLPAGYFPCW